VLEATDHRPGSTIDPERRSFSPDLITNHFHLVIVQVRRESFELCKIGALVPILSSTSLGNFLFFTREKAVYPKNLRLKISRVSQVHPVIIYGPASRRLACTHSFRRKIADESRHWHTRGRINSISFFCSRIAILSEVTHDSLMVQNRTTPSNPIEPHARREVGAKFERRCPNINFWKR
jgi:hypothetical protein